MRFGYWMQQWVVFAICLTTSEVLYAELCSSRRDVPCHDPLW